LLSWTTIEDNKSPSVSEVPIIDFNNKDETASLNWLSSPVVLFSSIPLNNSSNEVSVKVASAL
jgi:hypothetical protein